MAPWNIERAVLGDRNLRFGDRHQRHRQTRLNAETRRQMTLLAGCRGNQPGTGAAVSRPLWRG